MIETFMGIVKNFDDVHRAPLIGVLIANMIGDSDRIDVCEDLSSITGFMLDFVVVPQFAAQF